MTHDNHLASKLIAGVKDQELAQQLLQMNNPTLAEVHQKCESFTASKSGAKLLACSRNDTARHEAVHAVEGQETAEVSAVRRSIYRKEQQASLT